ncbi:MAG: rod shape-determining protein MreC [Bacteroidota bacterium]
MQQLFQFLYRYRVFFLFILLESVSFWLIVKNNSYQSAAYFNSANYYAAKALGVSNAVTGYLNLQVVNADLATENQRLHTLLAQAQLKQPVMRVAPARIDSAIYRPDSAIASRFSFKVAKVINNSTDRFKNFLTIDKGSLDGIRPGMGVISATGVVGKVKACSEHFSTVISLLHTDMMVSSKVKRNGVFGTARWQGTKPDIINLTYVPRHQSVNKGDTILTSDYNSTFTPGIMVGTVVKTQLKPADAYYEIAVALSTNFGNLAYVYVIENKLLDEQQGLENISTN